MSTNLNAISNFIILGYLLPPMITAARSRQGRQAGDTVDDALVLVIERSEGWVSILLSSGLGARSSVVAPSYTLLTTSC